MFCELSNKFGRACESVLKSLLNLPVELKITWRNFCVQLTLNIHLQGDVSLAQLVGRRADVFAGLVARHVMPEEERGSRSDHRLPVRPNVLRRRIGVRGAVDPAVAVRVRSALLHD